MTIQRQYQLPNCSLILDGLSIDPTPGQEEIMSLLVNAECRISGLERSLNGGYNFFAALVRAVSQYSQEVLSGFAHPQVVEGEPLLVHINPGEGPYHHLVVQPEVADLGGASDGRAIDIKLSAVQLFDLSEAVDQFFDDKQTLPELESALAPLPRRFVRADEPLGDRVLPAALGVGSLVAATMAFGLLPVPQLKESNTQARENPTEVIPVDTASQPTEPTGTDSIVAVNASSPLWENSPRIEDEGTLVALQTDLQNKLELNADTEASFAQPASYQVAVNEAGEVLGYKFDNETAAQNVDKTPLPRLARDNADKANLEEQAIAQYQATFDTKGIVAVTPWQASTQIATRPNLDSPDSSESTGADSEKVAPSSDDADKPKPAAPKADTTSETFANEPPETLTRLADVEALNSELKDVIVENRKQPRVGVGAAAYRVRISEDGTITGYQPVSSDAAAAIDETPLPKMVKSASEAAPSVDYRVVFTERGVVEVSPWWGWSYYRE